MCYNEYESSAINFEKSSNATQNRQVTADLF